MQLKSQHDPNKPQLGRNMPPTWVQHGTGSGTWRVPSASKNRLKSVSGARHLPDGPGSSETARRGFLGYPKKVAKIVDEMLMTSRSPRHLYVLQSNASVHHTTVHGYAQVRSSIYIYIYIHIWQFLVCPMVQKPWLQIIRPFKF